MHLSEQELQRRKEREELINMGIDPYPAAEFEVSHTAKKIKADYTEGAEGYESISIAGRLMSKRIMGSASFGEIQDSTSRIQFYVRRDDICPEEDKSFYNDVFKKKLDIGDIIGLKGYVFKTQVGETSIHVTDLTILTKSLRPLPIVKEGEDAEGNKKVWDAFKDPEQRYRQRYLDLIVNPDVKEVFKKRTALVNTIREFMNKHEYLEVETPILQPIHGGAAARPFKTHHNTPTASPPPTPSCG
jgi:lysyl-tRNA synthetase class 2